MLKFYSKLAALVVIASISIPFTGCDSSNAGNDQQATTTTATSADTQTTSAATDSNGSQTTSATVSSDPLANIKTTKGFISSDSFGIKVTTPDNFNNMILSDTAEAFFATGVSPEGLSCIVTSSVIPADQPDLKKFIDSQVSEVEKEGKLDNSTETTLGGLKAYRLEFISKIDDKDAKNIMYIAYGSKFAYIVAFSMDPSTLAANEPIINDMISKTEIKQ